jgi:succinylglutamate desuccinylase
MIKIFDTKKDGPNLVVMAGVHGDEPCGVVALKEAMTKYTIARGRITWIIGSPEAVAYSRREYQTNLNRMFRPDSLLSDFEKQTYEYVRSRELMPILAEADALLDIHSSTTPDTTPFIICEPQSYQTASLLPATIVVSGIDLLHPTGTDAYVNQMGGQGICIECGNHNDPKAVAVANEAIEKFLCVFGVIQPKEPLSPVAQRYIKADKIYKNKSEFILAKDFSEFAQIKQGEVIGYDGGRPISGKREGVILFPQNCIDEGREAFVLGEEISPKYKYMYFN